MSIFKIEVKKTRVEKYAARIVERMNQFTTDDIYSRKGTKIFYDNNSKFLDVAPLFRAGISDVGVAYSFKELVQYQQDYHSNQMSLYPTD